MRQSGSFPTRRAILGAVGVFGSLVAGSAGHQALLNLMNNRKRSIFKEADKVIPVFDAREVGLVGHARARRNEMLKLRESCIGPLTPLARPLVAFLDRRARNWLASAVHSRVAELDEIAAIAGTSGIYLLNASYEFGCTALASPSPIGATPRLLRTLDWPFDGLGEFVEVVRQKGDAGEFLNVTWPGAVGILTASAPGRFAASINQAPFRRFTSAEWSVSVDFVRTAWNTWLHVKDEPAMHLLRRVFETAHDYASAREMIATSRIARPAIFTLVGIQPGEMCVIERTEDQAHIQDGVASAANDWRYGKFPGTWEGLGGEAGDIRGDSAQRSRDIELFASKPTGDFDWVAGQIFNPLTRLAIEMVPASGHLRVRGYEQDDESENPRPITKIHDQFWPSAN